MASVVGAGILESSKDHIRHNYTRRKQYPERNVSDETGAILHADELPVSAPTVLASQGVGSGMLESSWDHKRHNHTRRKQFTERNQSDVTWDLLTWNPYAEDDALLQTSSAAASSQSPPPKAAVAPRVMSGGCGASAQPPQSKHADMPAWAKAFEQKVEESIAERLDRIENMVKKTMSARKAPRKKKTTSTATVAATDENVRDTWRKAGRLSQAKRSRTPQISRKKRFRNFRLMEQERLEHIARANERRERLRREPIGKVSRDLADSAVSRSSGKPSFSAYGNGNRSGPTGGVVHGSYLLSHNVAPEILPNSPKTQQVTDAVRRFRSEGRYPKRKSSKGQRSESKHHDQTVRELKWTKPKVNVKAAKAKTKSASKSASKKTVFKSRIPTLSPRAKANYGRAWTPVEENDKFVDPVVVEAQQAMKTNAEVVQEKVSASARKLQQLYEREQTLLAREKELMAREAEMKAQISAASQHVHATIPAPEPERKVAWTDQTAEASEVIRVAGRVFPNTPEGKMALAQGAPPPNAGSPHRATPDNLPGPSTHAEPLMAVNAQTNSLYRPNTHACHHQDLAWKGNPTAAHSWGQGHKYGYSVPGRSVESGDINWV